jgi:ribonuclease E
METADEAAEEEERDEREGEEEHAADALPKRRRRGKRGGRRRSRASAEIGAEEETSGAPAGENVGIEAASSDSPLDQPAERESAAVVAAGEPEPYPVAPTEEATEVAKPTRKRTPRGGRGGRRSRVSDSGERPVDAAGEQGSVDAALGEAADSITVELAEGEPEPASVSAPEFASEPPAKKAPRARPKRKPAAIKQSEAEGATPSDDAPVSTGAEKSAEAEPAPAAVEARPREAEGDTGGNGVHPGETRVSEGVDIGGDAGPDTGETRRRGWWQKLLD